MIDPNLPPVRLLALALALALALGAACREGPPPVDRVALAAETRTALENYADRALEVRSFTPEGGRVARFTDNFGHATTLCVLDFTARVAFARALDVPHTRDTEARLRQPDWTIDEIEETARRRRLFGSGRLPAQEERDLEAAGLFERVETGWRFIALDHRLRLPRSSLLLTFVVR